MHYVYLSLYYLSLVMMWIAGLLLGGLVHWTLYALICRAFAMPASTAFDRAQLRLERAAILLTTATIVLLVWFLVNKLVAMLGDINAL